MLNQSDKIERFTEVINKTAEKQCKKIKKQTDAFKSKEIKELETQSENELQNQIGFEVGRIETQTNREISALQSESKKKIAKVRSDITSSVFEKAKEKLAGFTKTSEYDAFLEKCILALFSQVGENAVIFVRSADEEKAKDILLKNSKSAEVSVSEEISLGGAYASNEAGTVYVYDTLETRLESRKEAFMASSGLSIV